MDYEFKTTFWMDFTIAEHFGIEAVKDTFERAFKEWRNDVVYVTELALVMNWKCWRHWEEGNHELGRYYSDRYYEVREWCLDNLEGDDLRYYFETTD